MTSSASSRLAILRIASTGIGSTTSPSASTPASLSRSSSCWPPPARVLADPVGTRQHALEPAREPPVGGFGVGDGHDQVEAARAGVAALGQLGGELHSPRRVWFATTMYRRMPGRFHLPEL